MAETSVGVFLDSTKSVLVDSTAPNGRKNVVYPNNDWELYQNSATGVGSALYLTYNKAGTDVSSYLYKKLARCAIYLGGLSTTTFEGNTYLSIGLTSTYNENTITWNNRPSANRICILNKATRYVDGYKYYCEPNWDTSVTELTDAQKSAIAARIYNSDAIAFLLWGNEARMSQTSINTYLYLTFDTAVNITSQVTATGNSAGYVNPSVAQTFTWDFVPNNIYSCLGSWTQASATFYWSSDNGSTWNSVAASGSTQSVTLAANTMPVGTILWKVTATDSQGTTTTSSVYEISTADELITSTPVAPDSTVEAGDREIVFTWNVNSPSGTSPKNSKIYYKTPETNWTYIDVAGSAQTYTMPANTLTAGTYTWGVQIQNQAGNWSTNNPTNEFVCVAAPAAPTVSATAVPFATIDWQSVGQQAYRIALDGEIVRTFFGTAKTYTFEDYLTDGQHTVSVEVQGIYGLWSQAGTVSFTVTNVPGDAVTLSGIFNRDAALNWETESVTADFLIYRDGVRIGHTNSIMFTDRVVLGQHSWRVVNRLASGYYTASNTVTGTLQSYVTAIASLYGGSWLELKLSENSDSMQSFSWSRTTSLRHMAGAVYPVLETSPFEDGSGSYDVSFPDAESARIFEQYKGKVVILKSRGGEVLIGCLSNLQKLAQDFYISYSFTVQRIHWEDYIDDA